LTYLLQSAEMTRRLVAQQLELEVLPVEPPPKPRQPRNDTTASTKLGPRLALSPDEAAPLLGVSRDYLDEHVIAELRIVRRGRRILIALTELERWLDQNATRATVVKGT
jgi:excisionase family DNA binding protein